MKYTAIAIIMCFVSLSTTTLKKHEHHIIQSESSIIWNGYGVGHGHNGTLNISSGFVTYSKNKIQQGELIIDMTSLSINDVDDSLISSKLKAHLLSSDFFNVAEYPTAKLVITDGSDMSNVKANMTIKDVTEEITFSLSTKEVEGGLELTSSLKIDRTKFGIIYSSGNFFEDLGDYLIEDEFKLDIKLIAK